MGMPHLITYAIFYGNLFFKVIVMSLFLTHKKIVLGVTGSIAAYKSPEIVRRLREAGAHVRVAMTENAKRFITPLTLQAVSGHPVHDDLFDAQAEAAMGHIELARWADVILIAPATADCLARMAQGRANDLLTAVCLASRAAVVIAPAMNQGMWQHRLTQENLHVLQQQNVHVFGPDKGSQACGDTGPGRLMEPEKIIEKLNAVFAYGKLTGVNVLLTAGPTHEAIDPVRFMTNGSSGKMGHALAEAAQEAGAKVTLISGPVHLSQPASINYISVTTAQEMYDAVMSTIHDYHIFISVAAVSDYRCKQTSNQKIHKESAEISLELIRNPDIVSEAAALKNKPFIVGFAAETQNVLEQAKAKLHRKKMDMMVANYVGDGLGMGADENEVIVIGKKMTNIARMPKQRLARELMTLIANEYKERLP